MKGEPKQSANKIQGRKFAFCPRIADFPLDNLIIQCSDCERYFAACCPDNSFGGDLYEENEAVCHHNQLVFTDGACSGNGRDNATSGLGITLGGADLSWSIPVTERMDASGIRTSQRAELLAAIAGLKKLHEHNLGKERDARLEDHEDKPTYILATDSEYVVKGITEWFPSWKRHGWRTASGKQPSNLDLFLKLDEYTAKLEDEGVEVGFWHVPRGYNKKADALAKRAAYR